MITEEIIQKIKSGKYGKHEIAIEIINNAKENGVSIQIKLWDVINDLLSYIATNK